jgi:phenylpropionate dioxygenase-like ring-hydroxylating dioxygenase large terminal subunit
MTRPTVKRRDIQRGFGNEERPIVKDLWARDSRPAITAMHEVGNVEPQNETVDFRRYYDPGYFQLELDRLWTKTWLFACREEDIPNVNDQIPVEVGPLSFFVVHGKNDQYKAFYNSCRHRGTKLCAKLSSSATIRCPYHGWEWNTDGTLKFIPSHWDFTHVNQSNGALGEVALGRWGGFIFINANPNPPPLQEALSVIPEHFREFNIESRYTAARYRKLVPANWKIVQEAFMESYHVIATHPAAVPYNGDSQSQYDIWQSEFGHVGRQVTPSAIPSMHAPPSASPLEAAVVYASIMKSWHYPDAEMPELDPKRNLRAQIAEWHRSVQSKAYGRKIDQTDAVMLDSTLYFMFPQCTFWLSESLPFTYQFTPHRTDPEKSYFDVRMLLPYPEGTARPPSSPAIEVGIDETIEQRAPAFGFLGQVFDQDMANMPLIQAGVRASEPASHHSRLGTYQEMIIRHWNAQLDRYLSQY